MGGGGSQQIITGYTYWGSFAGYLCLGPVRTLYKISNGDTIIWEGPITSSSADGNGMTLLTTTLGTIRFYWGTFTQNPDALLSDLEIDLGAGPVSVPMPAFRGLCYFVADDLSFGQQVTPPTLKFHYEKPTSGLAISSHLENGDAVLPEAIYDMLTSGLYGSNVSPGDIDAASFIAAAEQTIDEGLVASPDIDSLEQTRDLVGRMLGYIDGVIYFNGGKFVMALNRIEDPAGLESINESDLLEEPTPDQDQFGESWSRTIVTFHDRENKWEETGAEFEDKANAAIRGSKVTKVLNFPWITRREVADKLATHLGIKGGLPSGYWQLTVKPTRTSLRVGQLVKLSYAKFGIVDRLVRIKKKQIGRPGDPKISLEVFEERQRDIGNEYFPNAAYTIPGNTHDFTIVSTTPRLSWLPSGLKDGAADGFLVAANRPATGSPTGGEVWWTWSPLDQPYQLLAAFSSFPAKGTLLGWWHVRGASWVLRVQFSSEDYEWLQTLKDNAPEMFAVLGIRTHPANVMDPLAPWMRVTPGGLFDLVTPTVIDIEVESSGWFGSTPITLEDGITPARYPTEHIYFGRKEDFAIYPTDVLNFERNAANAITDGALVRYVKVPLANDTEEQSVTDVAAVTFDRDLLTGSPQGTYSRDWGAAVLSGYEAFDVEAGTEVMVPSTVQIWEDIDDALGEVFGGSASADETLLVESIDDLLGAMVENDSTIYGP
jgi:hypothetical protein